MTTTTTALLFIAACLIGLVVGAALCRRPRRPHHRTDAEWDQFFTLIDTNRANDDRILAAMEWHEREGL